MFLESEELRPAFHPGLGLRYPVVEKLTDLSPPDAAELVDRLATDGVLKRVFVDKIPACPSCRSLNVICRHTCPSCRSIRIGKKEMIEHVRCGYIAMKDRFVREEKLVCPNCRLEVRTDYRSVGMWFECSTCGKRFDEPTLIYICQACGTESSSIGIHLIDVFSYALSEEAKDCIRRETIYLKEIVSTLTRMAYKVDVLGTVEGVSGVSHRFDLVLSKEKMVEVVDIIFADDSVTEIPVISMFAKKYDSKPARAIVIAIPRMSEEGRKLAETYGIQVVEALNVKEGVEKLLKLV